MLLHPIADSFACILQPAPVCGGAGSGISDATGRALITAGQPGKIEIRAVAVDADGAAGEHMIQLKVRDPLDKIAPIVAIDLANPRLTQPAALNGSVQDSNLDDRQLQIAHQGSD